jgi:hypothetical protein
VRVIECNVCGETLSAAGDEELRECVLRHYRDEHDGEELDEDQVRELVSEQAYTASDS